MHIPNIRPLRRRVVCRHIRDSDTSLIVLESDVVTMRSAREYLEGEALAAGQVMASMATGAIGGRAAAVCSGCVSTVACAVAVGADPAREDAVKEGFHARAAAAHYADVGFEGGEDVAVACYICFEGSVMVFMEGA